jgi:signal transduction histidine kinase
MALLTGPIRWWWRRWSLRARVTVVATALFTTALTIAGFALLITVGHSLVNTLDTSAERTGNEVAVLVQSNRLPNPVLAGSGGISLMQVVDSDDRVIAASPGADAAVAILRPTELQGARNGRPFIVEGSRASTDEQLRVIAVPADVPAGKRTVLVATGLGRVLDSSRLLQRYLMLGTPIAVVVMASLTWWVVGLTLRPVAALQRGAAQLSATRLAKSRLPVPVAHDEIRSLATTLNDMLDRLETATSKQRRFVGDAAHELRSPIASLRLQLEVAARLGPAADLHELTDDALIDVSRLSHLIDDLLALARSDERNSSALRVPVRLDELARQAVAGYSGARVPVGIAEGITEPVTVGGDPDWLHRVLVNLINNAVRHARSQVMVSAGITTGLAGQRHATLTIADDGPGIPDDRLEQVFDRFYRIDSARSRDDGGTGLGLAIVREIVTSHLGTISLHNTAPGLSAEIRLPL